MKTQTIPLHTQAVSLQPASYNQKRKGTKRLIIGTMLMLSVFTLLAFVNFASAQELPPLTISDENHAAHILPTRGNALLDKGQPAGAPLLYHGGPVMRSITTYAIFWIPKSGKLQDGTTKTTMSSAYTGVLADLLALYPGHGIDNNNTQYDSSCYSVVSPVGFGGSDFTCYHFFTIEGGESFYHVDNAGALQKVFFETRDYDPSGCTDPITGTNCISDAQIQAEIQKVMTAKGWTGGLDTMFLLFTSSGEGSCFQNGGYRDSCAYYPPPYGSGYCGYHSYINANGSAIIYANLPYGNTTYCQLPGTPSPNNDPAADSAASVTSHELSEAITDPLLNAWWEPAGGEIGDKCLNYSNSSITFGTNTWDLQGGQYLANQSWGSKFFELQTEYDNHTNGCVQVGP